MREGLFEQEYMCSFIKGQDGQVYGRELELAEIEGRLDKNVALYDPTSLVHVAMDIGVSDDNALLWFQLPQGKTGPVHIIDAYSINNVGASHIVNVIKTKEYNYGLIFYPHDMRNREWGSDAISRKERMAQLGINGIVLKQALDVNLIDNVKTVFPRMLINGNKCERLLKAIEQYHREFDEEKQIYTKPLVDWSRHYCDALKYLCQAIDLCDTSTTPEALRRERDEALYGKSHYTYSNTYTNPFIKNY